MKFMKDVRKFFQKYFNHRPCLNLILFDRKKINLKIDKAWY